MFRIRDGGTRYNLCASSNEHLAHGEARGVDGGQMADQSLLSASPTGCSQTRPCVCQFKGAEDDAMAGATEKLAERGNLQSARSGVRRGRVVETPQLRGMLPK